jgi:hypothetical protein
MLDELIPQVETVQAEGAIVLLKWDGERTKNVYTVSISRPSTHFAFRRDTDDMVSTLRESLRAYRDAHRLV